MEGLTLAAVSSYADTNDVVSDYLVSQFSDSVCKLDSSSVADCLTTTPLSTSACEMNNVNSVQIAPHSVAVPQVKFSDRSEEHTSELQSL